MVSDIFPSPDLSTVVDCSGLDLFSQNYVEYYVEYVKEEKY